MSTVSSTSSTTSATTSTSTSSALSSSSTVKNITIDWDTLIEEGYQAKLTKADTVETKITTNQAKVSAYEQAQTLLQDLSDAADALRAPTGSSASSTDVFESRTAYLTANGSVTASDAVAVTVEDGSDIGSYDLAILQLATAHKVASDTQSSRTTDLGYDGVFSLTVEGGSTVTVTVDSGMTLNEIAEAINNTTDTSGVKAAVLQVSSGSYKLVLTAQDTGKTITAAAVSGDDVLQELGITGSDGAFANELQTAQDAIVELDGIEVSRDSNEIDDLVDGVTFHLYQTTPDDTSIAVEVGTNLSDVKTAVQTLVDAYNAYRDFAITQQTIGSDGTVSEDAVLYGDGTLKNISTDLSAALTTMLGSKSMSTIGLSFDSDNKLELDTDVLDDALLDDLDTVKSLLSFQSSTTSSDLMLLTRGTSTPSSITLDIQVDDTGTLSSASVNGDDTLFTIKDNRIVGNSGTIYAGLSFVYIGTTDQTVTFTSTTGIAELLYTTADTAADTTSGSLQTLVDRLTDQNTTLQDRVDLLTSRAESYKERITARYASYQAAISEAQATLSYLETLLNYNTSSDS
ncbi:flagellar filament capping protein FliD [Rhodoplanes roseus]|uniref:Flagellar hook-associated protein 2 n=1 Tax=Rhodoplanes roseus TaxID=29409 RepID=A0A327KXY2_9BRAD|nr:flagellar filament capping protein FliD [Rhodoplanes roseus]RAI43750.1 flagellar hook protein [Rhodoplanes roseus]